MVTRRRLFHLRNSLIIDFILLWSRLLHHEDFLKRLLLRICLELLVEIVLVHVQPVVLHLIRTDTLPRLEQGVTELSHVEALDCAQLTIIASRFCQWRLMEHVLVMR